jgi:integrase
MLLVEKDYKPQPPESQRVYLTIDEVKRLVNTECKKEVYKRAFLFSCFCGLRISDIERLKWCDLSNENGQIRADIRQKKTDEPLYLPLSANAVKWLPERGNAADTDNIFQGLCGGVASHFVKDWAKGAGITKNVKFHTARHTFATMLLTKGADLYTTSKLLGHKDISTTQIYAKIIDQKKTDAVNLLNDVF